MKPKAQPKGKYPGPGYDEAAAAKEMMAFWKLQQSRQYSPAPMSAAAKAKAGARGKATAARTKPKSTASKVVGALDKVGDFAIKALTKQPRTKQMYRQVGKGDPLNKLKDIKKAKK